MISLPNRVKPHNELVLQRLDEIEVFLDEHEQFRESFDRCMQALQNLATNNGGDCNLMMDFAPMSFTWRAAGLYGGMIFHGAWQGEGPTYSVCVEKTTGWSLHT
jgi:hypothetical protein